MLSGSPDAVRWPRLEECCVLKEVRVLNASALAYASGPLVFRQICGRPSPPLTRRAPYGSTVEEIS